MPSKVMIEWTKTQEATRSSADITVFEDGRIALSARLGGGRYRLSKKELEALRRFLFKEQRLLEIDDRTLGEEVTAAARRLQARTTADARVHTAPQMDAGTTYISACTGGQSMRLSYHDLTGDSLNYPDCGQLQRLGRVEARLLELARSLRHRNGS